MLLGILVGVACGYLLPSFSNSISIIGEIFLRLLSLLILPVIVVSMISGILGLNSAENLGRLGLKTLVYYTITTALAVITGLTIVNLIDPGKSNLANSTSLELSQTVTSPESLSAESLGGLTEVARNIFPKNIISAASEGNILGVIFFSILIGVALISVKHPGVKTIKDMLGALFEAVIKLVDWVMYLAPIGIFALVANLTAEFIADGKLLNLGGSIAAYSFTVITGLAIHGLFSLALIAFLFKINPLKFFLAMFPALTTAFSTASSAATLPLTIDSLRDNAGVPNKYASFVAPLGATINMDGTAIYEAIAAVFIANMYGIDLTLGQQAVIFLTATFSAIGAAGIPGAGLIMMTLVLHSVGLPAQGIELIVIVDRALDMLRTSINVWGDSIGAAVLAVSEGETKLLEKVGL
ncbi:MAG: dicarboxylate/amino acid:cation symporter [Bdellovibrionota bacterium]